MKMFDLVLLAKPLPGIGLPKGTRGAIVEKYRNDTFEVEFFDRLGRTIAVETVAASHLKPSPARFPIQHVGAPQSAMRGILRQRPLVSAH